jgi:hypothetical protein
MGALAGLRGTYWAEALRKKENRSAAAVLIAVAAAVWGLSQAPLSPGFAADLTARDPRLALAQATCLGFGRPGRQGRLLADGTGRIVWNRPLPQRFDLVVDARASGDAARPAVLRVGDSRHAVRFGPDSTRQRVTVDNRDAAREVAIEASGLRVSRVSIEEPTS